MRELLMEKFTRRFMQSIRYHLINGMSIVYSASTVHCLTIVVIASVVKRSVAISQKQIDSRRLPRPLQCRVLAMTKLCSIHKIEGIFVEFTFEYRKEVSAAEFRNCARNRAR